MDRRAYVHGWRDLEGCVHLSMASENNGHLVLYVDYLVYCRCTLLIIGGLLEWFAVGFSSITQGIKWTLTYYSIMVFAANVRSPELFVARLLIKGHCMGSSAQASRELGK